MMKRRLRLLEIPRVSNMPLLMTASVSVRETRARRSRRSVFGTSAIEALSQFLILVLLCCRLDNTIAAAYVAGPACPPAAAAWRGHRSSVERCSSNRFSPQYQRQYQHQGQSNPSAGWARTGCKDGSGIRIYMTDDSGSGQDGDGGDGGASSEEKMELAAEISPYSSVFLSNLMAQSMPDREVRQDNAHAVKRVVGAVTKAAVGVAVDRAAATVSEERGLPPPKRTSFKTGPLKSRDPPGYKRKTFASLLTSLVTFLQAEDGLGFTGQGKAWDSYLSNNSTSSIMDYHYPLSASLPHRAGVETVGGVMVNGYWFPSLAAASHAPAGKGFDFAAAAAEAAAEAARAKRERKRFLAKRRRLLEARHPKGIDFSCGAVRISAPASSSLKEMDSVSALTAVDAAGETMDSGETVLPFWRRWTVSLMERTGATQRIQQAVRDYVPRMPREALLLVVGVAGGELAKREITAQVEALEEQVRGPAWALLNETYRNIETRGAELVQSNWDVAALVTKELADWKRRGVGNSYQEALLKEVLELQTRALLKPISLPAEEGSLMVQLNATYRSIEESLGRLLPEQTKGQLALLEGLVRKLEDKGIGSLSFDEVYRALLLGAVPPTLVSDAVRLLAAGRPGEGGGAGFLSYGEVSAQLPSFYGGREGGEDVTLASLAARLNDTRAVSRVMTYTALAAETEVIDNLREVLDGLQTSIRTTLRDLESDLVKSERTAQPSGPQNAASYVNQAARSAITFAIDGFNNASNIFDSTFEALAEPSRRTLLRSSQLFPWQAIYEIWTNATTSGGEEISADSPSESDAGIIYTECVSSSSSDYGVSISSSSDVFATHGDPSLGDDSVSSHSVHSAMSLGWSKTTHSPLRRGEEFDIDLEKREKHQESDSGATREGRGLIGWWKKNRKKKKLLPLNVHQHSGINLDRLAGDVPASELTAYAVADAKSRISAMDHDRYHRDGNSAVRVSSADYAHRGSVTKVGEDVSGDGVDQYTGKRWKGDGNYKFRRWKGQQ